jgi:hypothetical protein
VSLLGGWRRLALAGLVEEVEHCLREDGVRVARLHAATIAQGTGCVVTADAKRSWRVARASVFGLPGSNAGPTHPVSTSASSGLETASCSRPSCMRITRGACAAISTSWVIRTTVWPPSVERPFSRAGGRPRRRGRPTRGARPASGGRLASPRALPIRASPGGRAGGGCTLAQPVCRGSCASCLVWASVRDVPGAERRSASDTRVEHDIRFLLSGPLRQRPQRGCRSAGAAPFRALSDEDRDRDAALTQPVLEL